MKKLTHEEILNYLKKEGILYDIIEDENDEDELEITGIKLNTISGIIRDLREKQKTTNDLIKQLKIKIKSKEGGVYFEKLDKVILKDQTINFQKDCYFLDCDQTAIMGCYITNLNDDLTYEIEKYAKTMLEDGDDYVLDYGNRLLKLLANHRKKIGDRPMLTIANQLKEK